MFVGEGFRCGFDKLQKFPQGIFFRRFELGKLDAHSEAGITAGHDAIDDQAFDPDLAVGHPEADFQLRAGFDRDGCFYQASANASVGKITPDWSDRAVDAQFDCDETLDTGEAATVLCPRRSKKIRLERWSGRGRDDNRLGRLMQNLNHLTLSRGDFSGWSGGC